MVLEDAGLQYRGRGEYMKRGSLIFCLAAFALVGCEKTSAPANKVEPKVELQAEPKVQQSVFPPRANWSPQFKDDTLNECVRRATEDMNPERVRRCKCIVEKASTTIPEQRFKAIGTDPEAKALLRQIGAAC
jgi:hypothetical protein